MHVRSLFLLIKPIVFFDVLVAVELLDLEVPFIQETYTKEVLTTTLDTSMDERGIEEPLMFMIELLNKFFQQISFFSCLIISVLDISPTW